MGDTSFVGIVDGANTNVTMNNLQIKSNDRVLIGNGAFENRGIYDIVINNVEELGARAFAEVRDLTSLVLSGVSGGPFNILEDVFIVSNGSVNNIPCKLQISHTDDILIGKNVFKNRHMLSIILHSENKITIEGSAFINEYKYTVLLNELNIISTNTIIRSDAFNGRSIKTLDLKNVTEMGNNAFEDVNNLEKVKITNVNANNLKISNGCFGVLNLDFLNESTHREMILELDINGDLTIEANGFMNRNISDITISANKVVIEKDVFLGNVSNQKITKVLVNTKNNGTVSIGSTAFASRKIKTIEMYDVISIGTSAFENVEYIEDIKIRSKSMNIEPRAFAMTKNTNNAAVILDIEDDNIVTIKDSAFQNRNISKIDISGATTQNINTNVFKVEDEFDSNGEFAIIENITMENLSIRDYAYYGRRIKNIDLDGVNIIGQYAFANILDNLNILINTESGGVIERYAFAILNDTIVQKPCELIVNSRGGITIEHDAFYNKDLVSIDISAQDNLSIESNCFL